MASADYVQVAHDGFARTFTYREKANIGHCPECGQRGKFRYTTQGEDRTSAPMFRGPFFCSIGCWRNYAR